MPDSPSPTNHTERLALILRLWRELQLIPPGTDEHKAVTERMRRETDAFRAALGDDEPTQP